MATQPQTARPVSTLRGFNLSRRPILAIAAIAVLAAVLNVTAIVGIPGGPLLAPGASAFGGDGFNGSGLFPADDRLPNHAWVANVVVTNYGSSDVSLVGASLVDVLPSTKVVGIYVDSTANLRCAVVTFDPACVAQAVIGGDIGVQTLAPGEETWLMVVLDAQSTYGGFRDVSISYRSGPLTYTTRLAQGAWVCVGVPQDACPENPWPRT